MILLLSMNAGFAQANRVGPKWLKGELEKRGNLYLLSETGYRNLFSIFSKYKPEGLLLGRASSPDSIFIFQFKKEGSVPSCINVQTRLLKEAALMDSASLCNIRLLDSVNFWLKAPSIKKQTIIILFNRVAHKRYKAFYKEADAFGKKHDVDIVLLLTDRYN